MVNIFGINDKYDEFNNAYGYLGFDNCGSLWNAIIKAYIP